MINTDYQNVILSNCIPEIEGIIENLRIEKYFTKIYTSGKIDYEKPNLKIFDYVINDLKIERKECIIIGNS